jgi:hypothetical protein
MELGLVPATRALSVASAIAAAGLLAAAVSAASPRFPPSIYPPAASFPHWGPPTGCASLAGVRPPRGNPLPRLLPLLARFQRVNELSDLLMSDRAYWPYVRASWHGAHRLRARPIARLRPRDVVSGPGRRSPYAVLIRRNCGGRLLARSWWVAACPLDIQRTRRCTLREAPALTGHFLFIDRRGHWLLWWTNS